MKPNNLLNPASNLRFLAFSLAKVPILQMDRAVQVVLSRLWEGRFRRSEDILDVSRIYEIAPPAGGAHLFKLVVFAPTSAPGYSVLVTNLTDGWSSLSNLLAKEHNEDQIQIVSTNVEAEFPQNRLEVWHSGVSTRVVMAMRDSDEWLFIQKGRPESFEELDNYSKRIKSKRLNRDILLKYLATAGFDVLDTAFWQSDRPSYYYNETKKV